MHQHTLTDTPRHPLSDTPLDGGISQVSQGDREQYRSALLGVYLASRPPPLLSALPPGLRPLTLPTSIEAIKGLNGELGNRAKRVATSQLCVGVYLRHMTYLQQSVVDLIGQEKAKKIFTYTTDSNIDRSNIHRVVYHVLDNDEPPPKPVVDEPFTQPPRKRTSTKARRAPLFATPPPVVQTDTELDIATMVTTVTAETVGEGDFSKLPPFVDPQSWTYSPFWREAYKVILVGGRFVKDPNPPPLGTPWQGYFYEYVEWNWNGAILSSFQNYLNVDFTVTASAIDLKYSLYNCRGSMLYARVAEGGIDVDAGGYHAEPLPTVVPRVSIEADKSLRYTPLVSRSTAHQGTALSAELLNYMAPGIVGMWIDDLIYESTRLWENS